MTYGPGFGWPGHLLYLGLASLITILAFAVVIGLIVLLVRFLLVTTVAAKIYIDRNRPPVAPGPAWTERPAPTDPTPGSPTSPQE